MTPQIEDLTENNAVPILRGTLAVPEPDEENHLIESPPPAFAVTDFKSASWVVTRIQQARAYAAMVKQWAAAEERKAKHAEAFFLGTYGSQLKELVQRTTEGTNKKSLNLIGGRAQLRRKKLSLQVVDDEAYHAWVQKNLPGACELRATIRVGALKPEMQLKLASFLTANDLPEAEFIVTCDKRAVTEHFEATGEVPPGCEVRGGEDEFYIQ